MVVFVDILVNPTRVSRLLSIVPLSISHFPFLFLHCKAYRLKAAATARFCTGVSPAASFV